MKDGGNRLEVCKLDITSPGPCLQKICSLELPPLMPWVSVHLYRIFAGWVPTSKNYARSRSSRASPAHFYSSTVGTITLFLNYTIPRGFYGATYGLPYGYALIIDVEALLDTIRTGVHNVPWADWGPSSTHLFQRGLLHLDPAGPSWITEFSPLMLRQYYPRRTRYTQSMPENSSSSSRTGPRVFSSTDVSDKLWGEYRVVTSLPYRDIVVYDINLSHVRTILADREWVVGMAVTPVVRGIFVYLNRSGVKLIITGGGRFCPYHGVPFSFCTGILRIIETCTIEHGQDLNNAGAAQVTSS